MTTLIPYVKAAQAVNGNIRFWASPWTPPTWMKTTSGTPSHRHLVRTRERSMTDTKPTTAGA